MTALKRLLKYPHPAVFDTSPDEELALRLRHPSGAAWAIADETLTVTVGNVIHVYDLASMTVAQLVTRLRADGFEVQDVSPTFTGLMASVLIEGANNQSNSNGDHLNGFKSLMWSLFGGYARELRTAKVQIGEAIRQMVITQAEGEWLDLWGTLYDVARRPGQDDADYAEAIPREAFRLRLNAKAIEKAIVELTGKDVRIEEPWRLMFRLDESALSGTHHMEDGSYYRPHVIQPVSTEPFDMAEVLAIIERNRAAGVVVAAPQLRFPVQHVDFGDEYTVGISRTDTYVIGAWSGGEQPLGVMRLDDNTFNFNHEVQAYQIIAVSNDEGLQEEQQIGQPRNIAMASIALSAGPPLGDQNAILSRGAMRVVFDPEQILSDTLSLGNIKRIEQIELVKRITTELHLISNAGELDGTIADNVFHVRAFYASTQGDEAFWRGEWDDRTWLGSSLVGMTMTQTSDPE